MGVDSGVEPSRGHGRVARLVWGMLAVATAAALLAAYAPGNFFFYFTILTITGMVYAVLLRPIEADVGLIDPWVNFVLHSLGPAALLIDWVFFPPEPRLARSTLWVWLVFPAIYLTVTLIRGPMVDWNPYPFLDPREVGEYPSVAAYSVAVLVVFIAAGWFLRWWADERGSVAWTLPEVA